MKAKSEEYIEFTKDDLLNLFKPYFDAGCKVSYEQGKVDALDGRCIEIPPSTVEAWIDVGRKQTLEEVLKLINEHPHRDMPLQTPHYSVLVASEIYDIKEWLEQKIKAME